MTDSTEAGRGMPKRIQRKRVKGWRMPEGAVYVGRPGPFGNPFVVGHWLADPITNFGIPITAENCLRLFEKHCRWELEENPAWLEPLRGKDLACWCPLTDKDGNPAPCHADVLLRLVAEKYGADARK